MSTTSNLTKKAGMALLNLIHTSSIFNRNTQIICFSSQVMHSPLQSYRIYLKENRWLQPLISLKLMLHVMGIINLTMTQKKLWSLLNHVIFLGFWEIFVTLTLNRFLEMEYPVLLKKILERK